MTGFDDTLVIGTTNVGDRHVASAAATIAPCTLVTNNLKDFDTAVLNALNVLVRTPDEFLSDLFGSKPDVIVAAMREAAANLTKTRPSWGDYLNILATRCGLQNFVTHLKSFSYGNESHETPER